MPKLFVSKIMNDSDEYTIIIISIVDIYLFFILYCIEYRYEYLTKYYKIMYTIKLKRNYISIYLHIL